MASKSTSPARISPLIGIPLSLFMIFIASLTFSGFPIGDGAEWPVLTTFRDKRSLLNILNHRDKQTPAWLYRGAKGVASMLWSVLIPLQHSTAVRRSNPNLHRYSGYMVILLSIELGLVGYYMSSQGMVTTHENWYHIHSFYNVYIPLPLLWWPTFDVAIAILGIFYFLSLYKLFIAIRARRIESHRRWAVFHTMTGYAISIERLIAVLVLALGWGLHILPHNFQDEWLRLPRSIDDKLEVELSALAWTLTAAGMAVAAWAYIEFTKTGLDGLKSKQGLNEDAKKRL